MINAWNKFFRAFLGDINDSSAALSSFVNPMKGLPVSDALHSSHLYAQEKAQKNLHPALIEVFVRHCHFSDVSQHKNRFDGFSREKCHANLMATLDQRVNVTYILDAFHPSRNPHFIRSQPVIEIKEGTETGSFLKMLDHVASLNLKPDTIIYFLEDDYLHREGWVDVLLEAFTLPDMHYATLFDHRDKYLFPEYQDLRSKIYHTRSCHWRTIPSTTNTYAMRFRTLLEHLPLHREYSLGRRITDDHKKFCKLAEMGATLISPIPGWSTHVEPQYASPCIDWEEILS